MGCDLPALYPLLALTLLPSVHASAYQYGGSTGGGGPGSTEEQAAEQPENSIVVYICLFSLLFLHAICVVIACVLCLRHTLQGRGLLGRTLQNDAENPGRMAMSSQLQAKLALALDPADKTHHFTLLPLDESSSHSLPLIGLNLEDRITKKPDKAHLQTTSFMGADNPAFEPETRHTQVPEVNNASHNVTTVTEVNYDNSRTGNEWRNSVTRRRTSLPEVSRTELEPNVAFTRSATVFVKKNEEKPPTDDSPKFHALRRANSMSSIQTQVWSCPICLSTQQEIIDQSAVGNQQSPVHQSAVHQSACDTRQSAPIDQSAHSTSVDQSAHSTPVDQSAHSSPVDQSAWDTRQLPCGHVLHTACLTDMVRYDVRCAVPFSCPLCRLRFAVSVRPTHSNPIASRLHRLRSLFTSR